MDDDTWEKVVKVVAPSIRKIAVSNVDLYIYILFYTHITLNLCPSRFSADDLRLPKVVGLTHI